MVRDLDPWSLFLSPEEWAALQSQTEGTVAGLGLELGPSPEGGLRVGDITPGGPADLAGIRPGALLLAIDGQAVAGLDRAGVEALLAGERGRPVTLQVEQGAGPQDLVAVRDEVIERAVRASLPRPGLALIRIERFPRGTREQLDRALRELEAENGGPVKAIVLDLRDNPGGLLEEAVAVVDRFVGASTVLESRGRGGKVLEKQLSHDDAGDLRQPLVVLVDEKSASAAEVVAGALQDLDRATLVGRPTYGKGTVQQVFEFEDGAALKLTVGRYHLPSGRAIQDHEGLQPDVLVEAGPGGSDSDPSLEAAWRVLDRRP